MTQVLTVSCKLKVSQSQAAKLDATLDAFVQALNWVNQNTPEKVTNAVKLQSLCYREIRARFGLSSNLAQQVCRQLAGARKVAQQKNRPVKAFKGGFATYDARIFSFREKDWTVSLTTVEGRERFELAIGNYQRGMLAGSNPKSATLVQRKDGSYYIHPDLRREKPAQATRYRQGDRGGLWKDRYCPYVRGGQLEWTAVEQSPRPLLPVEGGTPTQSQ